MEEQVHAHLMDNKIFSKIQTSKKFMENKLVEKDLFSSEMSSVITLHMRIKINIKNRSLCTQENIGSTEFCYTLDSN